MLSLFTLALAAEPIAIEPIRARWEAVASGKIGHCEQLDEPGEVRLDVRVDRNPNGEQRPAIGHYVEQTDVFRLWCHPEFVGPALKTVHTYEIAASVATKVTTLLGDDGTPTFILVEGKGPVVRAYYASGKPIRLISELGERKETTDSVSGDLAAYAESLFLAAGSHSTKLRVVSLPTHPWVKD